MEDCQLPFLNFIFNFSFLEFKWKIKTYFIDWSSPHFFPSGHLAAFSMWPCCIRLCFKRDSQSLIHWMPRCLLILYRLVSLCSQNRVAHVPSEGLSYITCWANPQGFWRRCHLYHVPKTNLNRGTESCAFRMLTGGRGRSWRKHKSVMHYRAYGKVRDLKSGAPCCEKGLGSTGLHSTPASRFAPRAQSTRRSDEKTTFIIIFPFLLFQ